MENGSSSSSSSSSSEWTELPSDILRTIASLLGPTIGLLRLRSICHPWRISLPLPLSVFTASIPLPSPFPPSPLPPPPVSLRPRLLFLFTPPSPSLVSDGVRILGSGSGGRINDHTCPWPVHSTNNNNSGGPSILGYGDGINDQHFITYPAPSTNNNNNNCGEAIILGLGADPITITAGAGIGVGSTSTIMTTVNNNNNCGGSGFLVNVEPMINPKDNNRFRLLTPLSSDPSFKTNSSLNLLDFGITFVCVSYALERCDFFRKIVVLGDFLGDHGDFVVLGLTAADGRLLFWKQGDKSWTPIIGHVRIFNDIASHNGKFYATADDRGRLVVIDVIGGRVLDVVSNLMYGSGFFSSLIGCDAGLYLVDRILGQGERIEIEVFKLDEKGRFWDYEFDLNDCVFFLGDGVNLWLSRKDYPGDVRNVIYLHDYDKVASIWDMKTRSMSWLVDNEMCSSLFSPPSKCFNGARQ